ncbi:hypothetical protein C8R45DRAFT_1224415 [Mycena sanguinolenta]|nr:hypothetical protein C8R45DRAFT_1224415 [Mycena sanguinolenta]
MLHSGVFETPHRLHGTLTLAQIWVETSRLWVMIKVLVIILVNWLCSIPAFLHYPPGVSLDLSNV